MRLVRFGAVDLVEDDATDTFVLTGRSALVELPNGAYDPDGSAYVGLPREFKRVFLFTGSEAETIQAQLDAFLVEVGHGRRLLVAETREEERRQTWAKGQEVELEYGPGEVGMQRVTATFQVAYPFWLATADEPIYLDSGYDFDAGWTFDSGQVEVVSITALPDTFSITNEGGLDVYRGTVSIAPEAGGAIGDFTLRNNTTGHEFSYSGSLTAGDDLVVDFLTKTVRLSGVDAYDDFNIAADTLDWMALALGENSFVLTGASITGTVTLRWRWSRHYL